MAIEQTALSVIDGIDTQQVAATMQNISRFQAVVQRALKQNHDFGVIPGTPKPTLLKPGAEKILMLMGLTSEYEVLERVENYESGVFAYTVKCTLSKGLMKVTEGLGSCNSKEDKYRWRWVKEDDLPVGVDKDSLKQRGYGDNVRYRIENEDVYSQVNTILKMAKKRAQVDATLTVAALSELFTQDLEDMDITGQRTESSYTPKVDNPANVELTFGKHRGKRLGEVPRDYVEWLADNARDDWMRDAALAVINGNGGNGQTEPSPRPEYVPDDQFPSDDDLASMRLFDDQ